MAAKLCIYIESVIEMCQGPHAPLYIGSESLGKELQLPRSCRYMTSDMADVLDHLI